MDNSFEARVAAMHQIEKKSPGVAYCVCRYPDNRKLYYVSILSVVLRFHPERLKYA